MSVPNEVSSYFAGNRRKINSFFTNDDYSITITFDNYETRIYKMRECLFGVFSILNDPDKFAEAFIDENGNISWNIDKNVNSNIVWNNKINLCTDSVYMNSEPVN